MTWNSGRGRGIRTPDILLPKQARYQTALYPVCPTAKAQYSERVIISPARKAVKPQRRVQLFGSLRNTKSWPAEILLGVCKGVSEVF